MSIICVFAWRQREVPDECKKVIIVSLHIDIPGQGGDKLLRHVRRLQEQSR